MPGGLSSFIGNPLNDGTWQYEWVNGRQLARMHDVDTDASFVYNENGLRVQKTVNGVVTKYTLHGKNIVHMTQGSNTLHFFYDAQNKPAVVVFNGTSYSYVKNLQGDIVAILDSDGSAVVRYKYDAWGRQIGCDVEAGSGNATALSTLNPFRYRGYVYDEETGLYYLRSRYYNTTISRYANADLLMEGNIFAYCMNNPTVNVDRSGYACVCCFDENGMECSFVTMAMSGGGGGGYAGGVVAGHLYVNNKEQIDESAANFVDTVLMGVAKVLGTVAILVHTVSIKCEVAGYVVNNKSKGTSVQIRSYFDMRLAGPSYWGKQSFVGFSDDIKSIKPFGFGAEVGYMLEHPYGDGCTCKGLTPDRSCPLTVETVVVDPYATYSLFNLSGKFGHITLSVSLDTDNTWTQLKDLWVNNKVPFTNAYMVK